ncbi:MAG: iron ABC transporter permease [Deltaproteobacteria bacterium]|nr:iron ABC transporter permease [Deltaproteobacteria bacterium]
MTKYFSLYIIFLVFLGFFLVLNIAVGSVNISFPDACKIIFQHITDSTNGAIIWKIRLPRALATALCGACLATAGLLLQVFFRNPIVGPYILGISSGAALMVALVMLGGLSIGIFGIHPFLISIAAFAGALGVVLIILTVAARIKNIITLLVIGLMMGYLCHAVTSVLIAFAEEKKLKGFVLWQMGSFSGFCWDEVCLVSIMGGLLLFGAYLLCKPLNAFLLGEDYAKSMGVNIMVFRLLIVTFSSALAGMVTAFAGPVAFIGLAVPHMARLALGTSDNRILIPGAALLGAIVTSLCDLIARILFSPVELPISAITAFFGAPIVIGLLLRRRAAI